LTGSGWEIVSRRLRQKDPLHRCPDISLARKALGWQPTVPLREGLKLTIEYFERAIGE